MYIKEVREMTYICERYFYEKDLVLMPIVHKSVCSSDGEMSYQGCDVDKFVGFRIELEKEQ